jgi:hypothetical protein
MTALSIQPTFPIFTDIDGQPLEAGYIFIGVANLAPIGNPINVYWDAALTLPAVQPIRTIGGYPVNNGTPARLYVNSDYSIQVQNRNGSVVYSAPQPTERISDAIISAIDASKVSYTAPGSSVSVTAKDKFDEAISITDYGAVGDGITPADAAIAAALANSDTVLIPPGTFLITQNITIPRPNMTLRGAGDTSVISYSGNNRRIICNQDNFTMSSFMVDGNKPNVGWETPNNYDFGLRVGDGATSRSNGLKVLDMTFKDIGLDGLYIDNCGNVLINDGCKFINCRRWGIVLDGGTHGTSYVTVNAKYFDCDFATGPLGKVYPLGAIDLEPYDTGFNCNWCVVDGAVCKVGDIRVVPSAPGTVTNTTIKNCTVIDADIRVFNVNEDVVFENNNVISSGNNRMLIDYTADSLPTQATVKTTTIKNARTQSFQTNGRANWLPRDFVAVSDGVYSTNGVGSTGYASMNIDGSLVNVSTFSSPLGVTPVQAVDLSTTATINTGDIVFVALQVDRTDGNADDVNANWMRMLFGPIDRRTSLKNGKGQWLLYSVVADAPYLNPSMLVGISASGVLTAGVTIQINRAFAFINPTTLDIDELVANYTPGVKKVDPYTGPTLDAYNMDFVIATAASAQNIDTINGGVVGKRLSLTTTSGNAVTLRDTSVSGGNIKLISGGTYVLDLGASTNAITLMYYSDNFWYQVS